MISIVIVIAHEAMELLFQLARQVIVIEQDLVFHRAMPAFDLPLCLWVIRASTCMTHAIFFQVISELARDITWAIVAQ